MPRLESRAPRAAAAAVPLRRCAARPGAAVHAAAPHAARASHQRPGVAELTLFL
jgi:hypothetical protein